MPFTTLGRAAGICATVAASVALAACGGSSTTTTSASQQHPSTTANQNPGAPAALAGEGTGSVPAPLVACLRKQGVGAPVYRAGQPLQAPAGVPRVRFERALRRCGVPAHSGAYSPPATGTAAKKGAHGKRQFNTGRFAGPHLVAALDKFALCMRRHGVDLPEPNLAGHGPIFRGKPISPSSPKFGQAEHACFPVIKASLPKPGQVKPRFNPGGKNSSPSKEAN